MKFLWCGRWQKWPHPSTLFPCPLQCDFALCHIKRHSVLFPLLSLDCPCELIWPTEHSGSDRVLVPSLRLKTCMFLLTLTKVYTYIFKKIYFIHWNVNEWNIFLKLLFLLSLQFKLRGIVICFVFIICSSDWVITPENQKENSNYFRWVISWSLGNDGIHFDLVESVKKVISELHVLMSTICSCATEDIMKW